jgi:ribulose 1,5-bisphosphate carboxylase large subunit-like protein
MIGGYSNDNPETILKCLDILRQNNTLPALSCGLHPGMIDYLNETIGYDYLANSGGSIHGHPSGTLAGAKALRQAIDHEPGIEYSEAIQIWGKK